MSSLSHSQGRLLQANNRCFKTLLVFLGIFTYLLGLMPAWAHHYQPKGGVAGKVTLVGSDTMANLVSGWADAFQLIYPQVHFQLQAAGSATAPPALTLGSANVGAMSRRPKSSEIQHFQAAHGYEPTLVAVARDAIILFVDLENPVNALSQTQVDAIFSVTRFCGATASLEQWQNIEGGEAYPYRMRLFGRTSVSGTYGLFKKQMLCGGDFKAKVAELPSSASIVQSVAFNKGAMGYAAWGYQSAGVKPLAVQGREGNEAVAPSEQSISTNRYPFSRTLFLLFNKAPDVSLEQVLLEFVQYIYSEDGQALTRREGYVPLTASQIRRQLRLLNGKARRLR